MTNHSTEGEFQAFRGPLSRLKEAVESGKFEMLKQRIATERAQEKLLEVDNETKTEEAQSS